MAELTKSGVCYDLENTPYKATYGEFIFHFSTIYHKRNFIAKMKIREDWLSDSLSRRFHYKVWANALAVFQLYRQIETRGFYVEDEANDKVLRSTDDISFVLHIA